MELAITEYSQTAAALGELRTKYEKVLFPVETPAGMKDAIAARAELRNLRVGLEKMRKEIKEPALERCRLIDSEAKAITVHLTALEDPIDNQIKAQEAKKAAEKAEAERIERERLNAIRVKIDAIRQIPATMAGEPSSEIAAEIGALSEFRPDASFGELTAEAVDATKAALEALTALHGRVVAQELEAQRLAAERAELDRLRAEQAERERIARQAQEADNARMRAEREQFEAERRAFMLEQANSRRQEEERLAREKAELAAQDEALQPATVAQPAIAHQQDQATANPLFYGKSPLEAGVFDGITILELPGMASTAQDDADAVRHFRDIVQELLNTRTVAEIYGLLEEEFTKVGLGGSEAA